jgi:hypothetical protein
MGVAMAHRYFFLSHAVCAMLYGVEQVAKLCSEASTCYCDQFTLHFAAQPAAPLSALSAALGPC